MRVRKGTYRSLPPPPANNPPWRTPSQSWFPSAPSTYAQNVQRIAQNRNLKQSQGGETEHRTKHPTEQREIQQNSVR